MDGQSRRKSLVMGIVLALLLGAVAGAVILALPIALLESITTTVGLSRLMVQAEPPIAASDRMLLAVLAGLFLAAVSWVLIDWLVFKRAGMSRLIRVESDDFEEEQAFGFRSTDPLDQIVPASTLLDDARRPLSALSEIGAPPALPDASPFDGEDGHVPPGVGVTPPPLASLVSGGRAPRAAPSPQGGWLPTPGLRPEPAHGAIDDERAAAPPMPAMAESAPQWAAPADPEPLPPSPPIRRGADAYGEFDKAKLIELLDRIERGLERRRAAAEPGRMAPPPGYAARAPAAMEPDRAGSRAAPADGELIDQPLHLALEALRSRLKP